MFIEIGQYRWSISWPVLGISQNGIRLAPSRQIVGFMERNGLDSFSTEKSSALRNWMNEDKDGKATELKSMVLGVLNQGAREHAQVYMQIGQYVWTLKLA